jgi:hypothetical protein
MSKIFISYRRDDTLPTCDRVYERLTAQFGKEGVFRDLNSIALGADYKAYIQSAIDQSAVELILIGPQWLNIQGTDGRRRLDDPDDNVRFEIEAAMHRPMKVIPLFVDGSKIPSVESLPPNLKQLNVQNGIPIRNGKDFDHDMGELITELRRIVSETSPEPSTVTGANKQKLMRIQLHDHASGNSAVYYKPPMCPVSAGSFLMGRRQGAQDAEPEHTVALPTYEIAMYPVTVAEYACFVRAGHPAPKSTGMLWEDQERRMIDHPVTSGQLHYEAGRKGRGGLS